MPAFVPKPGCVWLDVTKPFSPLELRARIEAVLRRSGGSPVPDVYRFGDVVVDFARCEVRRGGDVIDVTPVEFKLLSVFVKSRGRVLSRRQLLDEVWGDVHTGDRVVDTHVANLRKKIEPVSSEPAYHLRSGDEVDDQAWKTVSRGEGRRRAAQRCPM